jgi:hypothetical protein
MSSDWIRNLLSGRASEHLNSTPTTTLAERPKLYSAPPLLMSERIRREASGRVESRALLPSLTLDWKRRRRAWRIRSRNLC